MDYRDAGVDRAAGESFVESLKAKIKKTDRAEVLTELGDYACAFVAPESYQQPVFLSTTDGVGTKILLAEQQGGKAFEAVGQDVVAMCTNDLAACFAEPLVFLDYLATGKLEESQLEPLMDGIVEGCVQSGCSLAGGETAEMPGFYPDGRFDVAGFSVGVVEKKTLESRSHIQAGDVVVGFKSDGFHSNGFSLVRKVMESQGWSLESQVEGVVLSEYVLKPTKIYVPLALELKSLASVRAAAHITGGGLVENLPRVISEKFSIELDRSVISVPAVQQAFVSAANMEEREAFSTWNMGVGFVALMNEADANSPLIQKHQGFVLGRVTQEEGRQVKLL